MTFSNAQNRWEIVDTLNVSNVLAFMNETMNEGPIPVGTHPWYFLDTDCTDKGERLNYAIYSRK